MNMLAKKDKAVDLLQVADTAGSTGKKERAEATQPEPRKTRRELPKEATQKWYTGTIKPSHEGMIW